MAAVGVAATMVFSGAAQASHVPLKLTEGQQVTLPFSVSLCKNEGDAVSVVEEQIANGMQKAVEVYSVYVSTGACNNITGATFTPVRLVIRNEKSAVIEIVTDRGVTLFLLSPNVNYAVGDPA